MFASGLTASCTRRAASSISCRPKSEAPCTRSSTPCAPSMLASSSGLDTASSAARTARSSPLAVPIPMRADPAPFITDFTSAKSRLIKPGVVIRSVMPCTPARSTSSAVANASTTETDLFTNSNSRWLGTTIKVSTSPRRTSIPASAC